jgi:hypothetical protein
MDPISVAASILAITNHCFSTAKTLNTLRNDFKDAGMTISAICSETSIMTASLSHLQGLVFNNPDAFSSQLESRPELSSTFDTALTGCVVVFSVLDTEVQKLTRQALQKGGIGWAARAKVIWKEDTMKNLLQQIRGQQTALTLLIQLLQT